MWIVVSYASSVVYQSRTHVYCSFLQYRKFEQLRGCLFIQHRRVHVIKYPQWSLTIGDRWRKFRSSDPFSVFFYEIITYYLLFFEKMKNNWILKNSRFQLNETISFRKRNCGLKGRKLWFIKIIDVLYWFYVQFSKENIKHKMTNYKKSFGKLYYSFTSLYLIIRIKVFECKLFFFYKSHQFNKWKGKWRWKSVKKSYSFLLIDSITLVLTHDSLTYYQNFM